MSSPIPPHTAHSEITTAVPIPREIQGLREKSPKELRRRAIKAEIVLRLARTYRRHFQPAWTNGHNVQTCVHGWLGCFSPFWAGGCDSRSPEESP